MFDEKVTMVAINNLDFTAQDGNQIKGTKYYFTRDSYNFEKNWVGNKVLGHIFLRPDSKVEVVGYPDSFPCAATIVYVPAGRRNDVYQIIFDDDD